MRGRAVTSKEGVTLSACSLGEDDNEVASEVDWARKRKETCFQIAGNKRSEPKKGFRKDFKQSTNLF
jgi:hypothetical protein